MNPGATARTALRRVAPIGVVLATLALTGCATAKVDLSDLPEHPIAVSWWDSEDGRRRREMLNEADAQKTPYLLREGVAELGRVQDLLPRGDQGDVETRFPGRLVLLDPRTREIRRIEQAPPGARALGWSDDNRRLLFSTDRFSGKHQVYELEVESGEVRTLTRGPAHHIAADLGSGRDVVYESIRGGGSSVDARLVLSKGGGRGRTIVPDTVVRQVAFASDSSAIAYARLNDPSGRNARGPEVLARAPEPDAQVTSLGRGEHPVFTPDGQWIVYAAPATGDSTRLKRVRPDGSGRTSVGKAVRPEKTPAVSPDGRYVIYVSEHNGLDRLFIKRFDGTGDRLFFDGGEVRAPVW